MSELVLRYVRWLFAADLLLVVAHFGWGYEPFWNLDEEHNFPTWFSGMQLVVLGWTALSVYERERGLGIRAFPGAAAWAALAISLFYLSLDEMTVIHESVFREGFRDVLPPDSLWISLIPWQIVFAPFLAFLGLLLLALFFTRFAKNRAILAPALGGMACWAGAFLFEALAKPLFMVRGWYRYETALEEGLELAGATLLLLSFARYGAAIAREPLPRVEIREQARRFAVACLVVVVVVVAGGSVVAAVSLRSSAWLYRHNGTLLEKRGKHAEAIFAYRKALEIDPDDLRAVKGLALGHYRLESYDRALVWYDRALELRPGDGKLWNYRGTVLYRLGDYSGAERSYREAIRRLPGDAKAVANLGLALEKQGRSAEALEAFRRSREIDPGHETARDGMRRLGGSPRPGASP